MYIKPLYTGMRIAGEGCRAAQACRDQYRVIYQQGAVQVVHTRIVADPYAAVHECVIMMLQSVSNLD